ncbi:cytochrome-c peroxidase [Chitinophaga eiseniae]|uniref:cytochrome-c peroxidase n=1 Tax=Chitinophaga eiseniae TaxID=634771 RepID=UPI00135653E7|nr:cytochrome c peroxidase [Chitinophaga eiseniae]
MHNTEVMRQYMHMLDSTAMYATKLENSMKNGAGPGQLQDDFKKARLYYKQIEYLVEYVSPDIAKLLNGPATAEIETEDKITVVQPRGFQVIESIIFDHDAPADKDSLLQIISDVRQSLQIHKARMAELAVSDTLILKSVRLELFRLSALGISAYDAELSGNSAAECRSVLKSVLNVANEYSGSHGGRKEPGWEKMLHALQGGIAYLDGIKSDSLFNRAFFLTEYVIPVSEQWYDTALRGTGLDDGPSAISPTARTLFDKDAIDIRAFIADRREWPDSNKILLGKRLFYDPVLSGNKTRSCASCHNPQMAFTDGVDKSTAIDGKRKVSRNAPTLLNAGYQPALFYDARVTYMEDQITEVLQNPDEMHSSSGQALTRLSADEKYREMFGRAYPEDDNPITTFHLQNVIASYVRSLNTMNSPVDDYLRGNRKKLNSDEINGLNLYLGKARCASCHFLPLFNGALPPDFTSAEAEVIGVTVTPGSNLIDPDKGMYNRLPVPEALYSFKVPTLRNIGLTAPYMHNGKFRTLEEVIDFYDAGGGWGRGVKLPNQTLPAKRLNLSAGEKTQLIAFLQRLTDTTIRNNLMY